MRNDIVRILTFEEAVRCDSLNIIQTKDTDYVKEIRRSFAVDSLEDLTIVYRNNNCFDVKYFYQGFFYDISESVLKLMQYFSIRPVMPLSYIPDEVLKSATTLEGKEIIKYGYFPQSHLKTNEFLVPTTDDDIILNGKKCAIYETNYDLLPKAISETLKPEKVILAYKNSRNAFKVEPVEWYIIKKLGIAISKYNLMTGKNINSGKFKKTELCEWLNTEFLDILLKYEKNYYLESLHPIRLDLNLNSKSIFEVDNDEEVQEYDFDSMVNEASKQMEEILGHGYTKKIKK